MDSDRICLEEKRRVLISLENSTNFKKEKRKKWIAESSTITLIFSYS